MTNNFYTIILILLITSSCSTIKHNKPKSKAIHTNSTECNFNLSLNTKLFLLELNNEKEINKRKEFIPSKKLIDKYSIKKYDGNYTISGFIKINTTYNENDLTLLNIKTNSKISDIITIIIPINSIEEFLNINGIIYFEISQKVNLKSK